LLKLHRRQLLVTAAAWVGSGVAGKAGVLSGQLPWEPNAGSPPEAVRPGPWQFFTAQEAAAVEALADRIIPPDPQTPGGKDAGCAVFIDRQLAGPYGRRDGLYLSPPFQKGLKVQGPQGPSGPAAQYRAALAALDTFCRSSHGGKVFAELPDADKDNVLGGLEHGKVKLDGVDGQAFFDLLIDDMRQGFFADPIYGGNRDMAAWRMIGFPGARYDYRDWVNHHNERYPHPPVSLQGRIDWIVRKS
jgi:gluconate 2-dehydrogenase gamma chain